MPDKELKTISATQSAALFDASPYLTRWLLWRVFKGIDTLEELDADDNERMFWGNALEPVIFYETLRRLNLEGRYNEEQDYVRDETLKIGCTPDGEVWHPSKGKATVQVKCVDWFIWKDQWVDDTPPPHIVAQVQHEMLVMGSEWAVIPCLIGGNELRIYEMYPDEDYQEEILKRVEEFFVSVSNDEEPDPLGVPMEQHALLTREYKPKAVADVTGSEEAFNAVQALRHYTPLVSTGNAEIKKAKAKLLALSGGCEIVKVHGYGVAVKQSPTKESSVELPDAIRLGLTSALKAGGLDEDDADAIDAAIHWRKVNRKAGVITKYDTWEEATDATPSWLAGFDVEIMGA